MIELAKEGVVDELILLQDRRSRSMGSTGRIRLSCVHD
jgi:hypothetical protein